ncbi:MAG: hypothetical protein KAU50_12000 [Candidatus Marinimicrobia bacterium]|nr:hypothetical protein [Candidatus Neomarinimicrobiota bacterium]
MDSQLTLSPAVFSKLVSRRIGSAEGVLRLSLGKLGSADLIASELAIEAGALSVPIRYQPGGSTLLPTLKSLVTLSDWHYEDGTLRFRLTQLGAIPGTVLNVLQQKLAGRFQEKTGNRGPRVLDWEDGWFAVQIDAWLNSVLQLPEDLEVTGITVTDYLSISFC